jgi:hypothetical protein
VPGEYRERIRRIATGVAFVVGVGAIAATTPAYTTIDIPAEAGSFSLDADRPASLSRIIVRLSPEATSAYSNTQVTLIIDEVSGIADDGAGSIPDESVRFIVTSGTPDPGSIAGESTPPVDQPIPSAWQAEVRHRTSVSLPLDCGSGPCERAFWLIAQLSDAVAGPVDVQWHVDGALNFSGNTWPSGAGGSLEIDPPILVDGELPQLVVSTPSESLTLGPRNPAAARVIELRIGAAGIPGDGTQGAVLSVDLERRGGGSDARRPLIKIYPLNAIGVDPNPDGPLPTAAALGDGFDPFGNCDSGDTCTRRYLVTFEWTGDAGETEEFDWTATVRRLDVARAWSAPAKLSATIERRFDIDGEPRPTSAHLEGEATTSESGLPAQVQIELAAQTTATDPIFRLLPAPAVMTYRADMLDQDPSATGGGPMVNADVTLPGWEGGGVTQIHTSSSDGRLAVTANPFAGCAVGDACPSLTISTVAVRGDFDAPRPTVRYAWSLDVTLFSFAEAPLTLSTLDHSP